MEGAGPDRPPQDGADAVFVGATRYTGPAAWLRLAPGWKAMVAQMRRMPGYRGHGVYYERPWTLGTVGFFGTRDDLMRFARTGEHRELMSWVVADDRRHATGGYIRVYEAVSDGDDEAVGVDDADRAVGDAGVAGFEEGTRAHR